MRRRISAFPPGVAPVRPARPGRHGDVPSPPPTRPAGESLAPSARLGGRYRIEAALRGEHRRDTLPIAASSISRCIETKNPSFLNLRPGIPDHGLMCVFKRAMIGCLVLSCAGFAQGQDDRSTDLGAPPGPTAGRVRRFRLFNWPGRRNPDPDRANSDVPTPSPSIANQVHLRWTPLSSPKNGDPSLLSRQALVAVTLP